jgi:Xaa-Pro aminopeptidase
VIARRGIVKESRIGCSVGLSYPPDWGERTLSLRPGDKTELRPNMTIHGIPGVCQDNWGIEISECILIIETGAAPLCAIPRQLFVKDSGRALRSRHGFPAIRRVVVSNGPRLTVW